MNYTRSKIAVLTSLLVLTLVTVTIVGNLQSYSRPIWSPNSELIAFEARNIFSRRESIYVINSDGSERRNLTGNLNSREPVWSPNGKKVAFICYPSKDFPNQPEICIVDANGSEFAQLTYDSASFNPTWSPNGKQIAFTSNQNNTRQISIIDVGNLKTTRLINNPIPQELPSWSPDGSKIAFVSQSPIDFISKIFVVNINDKAIQYVGNGISPTWSPDGSKIAFTTGRVYVVNSDGSKLVQLSYTAALASDSRPTWSNDGEKIAFFSPTFTPIDSSKSVSRKIYTVASDGSEPPRYLTDGISPTWSFDDTRIAFKSRDRLVVINLDTSRLNYLN